MKPSHQQQQLSSRPQKDKRRITKTITTTKPSKGVDNRRFFFSLLLVILQLVSSIHSLQNSSFPLLGTSPQDPDRLLSPSSQFDNKNLGGPSRYHPTKNPFGLKPTDPPRPLGSSASQSQLVLQKRWSGWSTVTVFVNTVTINVGTPPVVTVAVNPADQNQNQGPGTVTVTVGAFTQTVYSPLPTPTPQPTSTVYVSAPQPTTIRTTSLVTINSGPTPTTSTLYIGGTSTSVPASGSSIPWFGGHGPDDGLPADRPCYPGEENIRQPGHLRPTSPTQTSTLFAIALYFVIILICWNLFFVRHLLFALKVVVVAWHEFGHVVAASVAGCKLDSVTVDPNEGGATRMEGIDFPSFGLPLGYICSCLFGGLFVFCGFNTLASKIASFFLIMSLITAFWWATGLTARFVTLCTLGLLIGFWFIDHAGVLRYFILFVGVMSSWYVIYDVMDDFVFRKLNSCCPVTFEHRYPRIRAGQWALIWTIYSGISFAGWIMLALVVWRQTPRSMFCQSQQFLPT